MISTILMSVETTLLLSVAALYIVQCPFNKVEESFNTQAVHDIVNIFPNKFPSTTNLTSDRSSFHLGDEKEIAIRSQLPWDHTLFPGVVPRTFVGAFMVGLPMRMAKYFMLSGLMTDENTTSSSDDHDLTAQFILQIGSRFALTSFLVLSMSVLLRAIQRRYGLAYRLCFLIITVSQFHYLFYGSRFLPNTFAAILANLVFASWISRQYSKSIIYIAACVVIFRFDTAIFFGWLLIDGVFIRRFLPLGKVLKVGIPAGMVSLMITFIVDSILWAHPVWPELVSLYFNVWLNKSHEWGVQPYFWYVYNCIPRIMMASFPLILLAEHKFTREYFIPVLAFIITYSFLPHKELRFILFIVPLLNLCAASGLMNVHYYLDKLFVYLTSQIKPTQQVKGGPNNKSSKHNNNNSKASKTSNQRSRIAIMLFSLIIVGMFIVNLFASYILARISSHNYPGGQAALSLGVTKELLDNAKKSVASVSNSGLIDLRSDVGVYVDNLAAQTGVSRFVQVNGAYYSKTPRLNEESFRNTYSLIYLLLEPVEIKNDLLVHCAFERNQEVLFENEARKWSQGNDEIRCTLPNQAEMYCSIIDTVASFKSVNIGGLLKKLRQINSIKSAIKALDDDNFIKTRTALHIIRCSTRSKFNPFA